MNTKSALNRRLILALIALVISFPAQLFAKTKMWSDCYDYQSCRKLSAGFLNEYRRNPEKELLNKHYNSGLLAEYLRPKGTPVNLDLVAEAKTNSSSTETRRLIDIIFGKSVIGQ